MDEIHEVHAVEYTFNWHGFSEYPSVWSNSEDAGLWQAGLSKNHLIRSTCRDIEARKVVTSPDTAIWEVTTDSSPITSGRQFGRTKPGRSAKI
jgi:hypothetical protein